MKEVFKSIKGYEDFYLISNLGNVYSFRKNKILKLAKNKDGYSKVALYKGGKISHTLAHILVAKEFIPNPENKPFVLHKKAIADGGSNSVDNLYWGTQSDNMKDRVRDGRQPKQTWNVGNKHPFARKIIQYDLNYNFIKEWDCIMDASNALGIKHQHIWRVLNKMPRRKSVHGFIFEYA